MPASLEGVNRHLHPDGRPGGAASTSHLPGYHHCHPVAVRSPFRLISQRSPAFLAAGHCERAPAPPPKYCAPSSYLLEAAPPVSAAAEDDDAGEPCWSPPGSLGCHSTFFLAPHSLCRHRK
nr:unnamed protein product [Digitaria exilis]